MNSLFFILLFPSFMLQYVLATRKKRIWAIILPIASFLSGGYSFFVLYPYMDSFSTVLMSGVLFFLPSLLLVVIYFVARKISKLPFK